MTQHRPLRLQSSLRTVPADRTWRAARDCLSAFNITRVTDVTRMDRLGLPVCVSVRPRGLALRVHAGKGLTLDEARVGAAMEAIEFAVAEPQRTPWVGRDLRMGDLQDHWAGRFDAEDLAPRFRMEIPPDMPMRTVACEDLATGQSIWLPAQFVFVPYPLAPGSDPFGWSTNGLASGNSPAEATLHGLFEVLERDALAMNLARDESLWLAHDQLPFPFGEIAADWSARGIDLAVRYVPNEFGWPCFTAMVHEGGGQTVDLARGSGLHADATIALARAVCEAAQSRLSGVHGGRDDITTFFDHVRAEGACPDARERPAYQQAFDTRRTVAWADIPSLMSAPDSLEELLQQVLHSLARLGFAHVLRYRFDIDLPGLHVMKVIVPRTQEMSDHSPRVGRRLYQRATTHA